MPCFQTIASFSGKRLEVDRRELGDALLGEVGARLGVDQLAFDQVVALLVGVEDVGADAQLVEAGHGRLGDLVDLREVGHALGDVLADRGFVGEGEADGEAERRGPGRRRRARIGS